MMHDSPQQTALPAQLHRPLAALMGTAGPLLAVDFYPAADESGHYPGWQGIPHHFAVQESEGHASPLLLKQTHSATLHEVHQPEDVEAVRGKEGDGLICSLAKVDIAVITADCVPVLLLGSRHVAALHCGWRGIERGLLDNALHRLNTLGEDLASLRMVTGPYIQPQAFEVGPEVIAAFAAREWAAEAAASFWQHIMAFASTKGGGDRWYFDMGLVIAGIALAAGLMPQHIAISRECTKTTMVGGRYPWPSYRRSGKGCGRVISSIRLASQTR